MPAVVDSVVIFFVFATFPVMMEVDNARVSSEIGVLETGSDLHGESGKVEVEEEGDGQEFGVLFLTLL